MGETKKGDVEGEHEKRDRKEREREREKTFVVHTHVNSVKNEFRKSLSSIIVACLFNGTDELLLSTTSIELESFPK
jgi:hypothetical protein